MKEVDGGHCSIHMRRITPEINTYLLRNQLRLSPQALLHDTRRRRTASDRKWLTCNVRMIYFGSNYGVKVSYD
ncbi:hypothetical protein INR49_027781 [Caranx melampygus]|nr:hypothetical protein INR49_027781 [Caranx melampygus]